MYIPYLGLPVYDIIIGITFLLFILSSNNVSIIKQIINYIKIKPVKILVLYVIWIILSGLIQIISGKYSLLYALYAILILFMYNNLLWFLYPGIIFPKMFSLRTLIKFLMIGIYVICIYGLIVYFLDCLNIPILKPIHHIIVNRRLLVTDDIEATMYISRDLSVFEEPGYFGSFICINLPIIYSTILGKYKIFKNKIINILFKKTYIPIIWITILFIKSPIWLILSILSTIIYFRKQILNLFKRFVIYILVIILTLSLTFISFSLDSINISETYLGRVERTVSSFGDMNKLVKKEPSLANRILSYIVRYKIFLKNPITGIGYKNAEFHAQKVFSNLEYPLTEESLKNLLDNRPKMGMNGAIFWNILSDCGIIGFLLFYTYLISLIKYSKRLIKYLNPSIEKVFLSGVRGSYISILVLSIYDLRPNFHYFWFLFGLTICFAIYTKRRIIYDKNMD